MPETQSPVATGEAAPVVTQLLRLIAPHPPQEITAEQQLIGDLGFHSLALAELGFSLEDLFGLDAITPERAMTVKTVGDILDLVEQAVAAGEGAVPPDEDVRDFCAQHGADWAPQG